MILRDSIFVGLSTAVCLTCSVMAQNSIVYSPNNKSEPSSQVTLQPTDEAGGVAEVVFQNEDHVHSFHQDDFVLTLDDLEVQITLKIDLSPGGPDTMIVSPPDGYFAVPQEITVNEGASGTVLIFSMETPSS